MPNRFQSFLGVHPGEERLAVWMVALFALTQASQGLGANTADALFFVRFGVESLPAMIFLSGPVVLVASLAHAGGLGRFGPHRWLPWIMAGFAVLLVVERLGVAVEAPAIYPVVWLGGQVVILLSFTVMWTAAGEACNTRQARRLYPLFASAGIAGGVIGNAATGPLAAYLGTENLLLVQAGLLTVGAMTAHNLGRKLFAPERAGPRRTVMADLRAGLEVTRRSPLLRLVAWVAGLSSLLFFLVVFPFSEIVTRSFRTEVEVAGFLGLFSAIATAGTFLVSLLGAKSIFARLGVVGTLLIVFVVYLVGFAVWLPSFGLVTAAAFRGLQWVAVNALGATAMSALFNVLPGRQRGQVMAFVNGVPTQIGTMFAGGLLLAGALFSSAQRSALGLLLAACAGLLAWRMRPAYSTSLVDAVRQGRVEVFTGPLPAAHKPALKADAQRALADALLASEPHARALAVTSLGRGLNESTPELIARMLEDPHWRVRLALVDVLSRSDDTESQEQLLRLATDPAPQVRRRVLQHIADEGGDFDRRLIAALSDGDSVVRANAAVVVGGPEGRRTVDELLASPVPADIVAGLGAMARRPHLSERDPALFRVHPDRRIRAAAASALQGSPGGVELLREMLDDPSILVRQAAAFALAHRRDGPGLLRNILETGSARATEAALQALADIGHTGDSLVNWASQEVARVRRLRTHRLSMATSLVTPTQLFLQRLLAAREARLARWALLATTAPQTSELMKVVSRGIWSSDPEIRAQAYEALDSVGARSVTRCLIPLLEETANNSGLDARSSLRQLSTDHDPWIRALAVRGLAEELAHDLSLLRQVAVADQSGLLRSVVSRWQPPIMEQTETLDTMDRVIALQRVAMFADVDPEDLERVAVVSSERRYEPGELIFAQGEGGNEMIVIVSGNATVSRTADGISRLIRTCGPGEHVGELSLLRNQPRAADVIAGPDGVHALVLEGLELQSILEDRPEVAMAMLATLAERLGSENG